MQNVKFTTILNVIFTFQEMVTEILLTQRKTHNYMYTQISVFFNKNEVKTYLCSAFSRYPPFLGSSFLKQETLY